MICTVGDKPILKHDLVTRLREDMHLSKSELARRVGITRAYLQMIERGKADARVSGNVVMGLARELHTTMALLYGEVEAPSDREIIESLRAAYHREGLDRRDAIAIPIRGNTPAGYPLPEEQRDAGTVVIERITLSGVKNVDKLFALAVTGSSLSGDGIHDGDLIIVDPESLFVDGRIYIVRLGSEVVARHVYRQNGTARLVASNGEFKEITADELDILGRVILSMRPPIRH